VGHGPCPCQNRGPPEPTEREHGAVRAHEEGSHLPSTGTTQAAALYRSFGESGQPTQINKAPPTPAVHYIRSRNLRNEKVQHWPACGFRMYIYTSACVQETLRSYSHPLPVHGFSWRPRSSESNLSLSGIVAPSNFSGNSLHLGNFSGLNKISGTPLDIESSFTCSS